MFDGEKSNLFWVGLIVLGFASLALFTTIWQNILSYLNYLSYSSQYTSSFAYNFVWSYVPIFAGAIIFMLIGYCMMKSGVKKVQASQP